MRKQQVLPLALSFASVLLLVALLLPRPQYAALHTEGFLVKLLREIIFVSGPLEVAGNFLVFIPIFLSLIYTLPQLSIEKLVFLCVSLSGVVEIIQNWIPGRVSSTRDFICNLTGILIAVVAIKKFPRLRPQTNSDHFHFQR